jgi:hypothetical protein
VAGIVRIGEGPGRRSGARGDVLLTLNTDFTDKEIALVRTRIAQVEIQMEKADKDLCVTRCFPGTSHQRKGL